MTVGVNDYPWSTESCLTCSDTWGYTVRQCVSFIAWRISNDLGLKVPLWGSADTWASDATKAGVSVDNAPAVGSILQLGPGINNAGPAGHVAWVLEVGPSPNAPAGYCYVENYNYDVPYGYSRQTIKVNGSNFIHIAGGSGNPGADVATLTSANTTTTSSSSSNPLSTLASIPGAVGNILSGQVFVWGGEVVIGAIMLIAGLWLTAGKPGSGVVQAVGVPVTAAGAAGKVAATTSSRRKASQRARAARQTAAERAQRSASTNARRRPQRAAQPRERPRTIPGSRGRAPRRETPEQSRAAMDAIRSRNRDALTAYRRRVQSTAPSVPF